MSFMLKAINWRQITRVLGLLVLTESFFMLIAAGVGALYGDENVGAILDSALITAVVGTLSALIGGKPKRQYGIREGYIIVGLVWIVFSFFGMLPFLISGGIPDVTNAFFETMSGFTTTGASILTDIEAMSHGLLFWRSIIQWLGGMGIVVLSLAILPLFGAGMQLYQAEVPGPTYDRLQPRIKDTARRLWGIYLIFTVVEAILLKVAGMDLFDAICHSLTTMATGGYSTKQDSIAFWSSPWIHYIIIFFMLLAGTNFSLLYMIMVKRNFKRIASDDEFRIYISLILIFTLIITFGLAVSSDATGLGAVESEFRTSLFQVVSIITTTGFATTDFMLWKPILWMLLLVIMFTGASAGSTSGGVKLIRIVVVAKNMFYEFRRLIHPKAIMPVRVNKHVVSEKIINNIHAFVTVYVFVLIVSTLVLILSGMDVMESFSAALTSISNVGPGLGKIGPAGNFADIPTFSKWFLAFLMLVGRLEFFTILLIFSPAFWRK